MDHCSDLNFHLLLPRPGLNQGDEHPLLVSDCFSFMLLVVVSFGNILVQSFKAFWGTFDFGILQSEAMLHCSTFFIQLGDKFVSLMFWNDSNLSQMINVWADNEGYYNLTIKQSMVCNYPVL